MATPYIAGIAALVKQKYPTISPAAISSALMTSAFVVDHNGQPLLAQNPSSNTTVALGLATPFDFVGGGGVLGMLLELLIWESCLMQVCMASLPFPLLAQPRIYRSCTYS